MQRPWHVIPIHDNGEPLQPLPPSLRRLEPHPYQRLGAPYGEGGDPYRLRRGVVEALGKAQDLLAGQRPGWRLAIFDAWRPLAVQRFMVDHATSEEGRRRGLTSRDDPAWGDVKRQVSRFWAAPSQDPATPPPHSTGGAVDLTIVDASGTCVSMGGAIDELGAVSEPDHYAELARSGDNSLESRWHGRRKVLAGVMASAGFVQHPNEWWHFSRGISSGPGGATAQRRAMEGFRCPVTGPEWA